MCTYRMKTLISEQSFKMQLALTWHHLRPRDHVPATAARGEGVCVCVRACSVLEGPFAGRVHTPT